MGVVGMVRVVRVMRGRVVRVVRGRVVRMVASLFQFERRQGTPCLAFVILRRHDRSS